MYQMSDRHSANETKSPRSISSSPNPLPARLARAANRITITERNTIFGDRYQRGIRHGARTNPSRIELTVLVRAARKFKFDLDRDVEQDRAEVPFGSSI